MRPLTPTITGATEVQELQNVTLTCYSASQINIGSLTYTWYGVSGSAISSLSTGTYSIYLVSYADSGSYSCEVTYDTATSNRSAAYFLRGMLLYLLIYLFEVITLCAFRGYDSNDSREVPVSCELISLKKS